MKVFLTTSFVYQGKWRAPQIQKLNKNGECGCVCNVVEGGGRRRSLLASNLPVLADFVRPVMLTSERLAFLESTGEQCCVCMRVHKDVITVVASVRSTVLSVCVYCAY